MLLGLQLCRHLNYEERFLISLQMCSTDLQPAALWGNKGYVLVWPLRALLTGRALSGGEEEFQGMAGG